MASFLPTREALVTLAKLIDHEPSDPAVSELFDQLLMRGHLTPWLPGWWELIRWGDVEREVASRS